MKNLPTFYYDDACEFCCRWVARWNQLTQDSVRYQPLSDPASSCRFQEIDGSIYEGAQSIARLLSYTKEYRWMLWVYEHVPAVAFVSERLYGSVSSCRVCASKFSQWFFHV